MKLVRSSHQPPIPVRNTKNKFPSIVYYLSQIIFEPSDGKLEHRRETEDILIFDWIVRERGEEWFPFAVQF